MSIFLGDVRIYRCLTKKMNIIFPLRDYVASINNKKQQPLKWHVLAGHDDFPDYGFEFTDTVDILQDKLLKTTFLSGSVRPDHMDVMIERVSKVTGMWKELTSACYARQEIKKKWYKVLYPDPEEIVPVIEFKNYSPQTKEELLIRWLVTKDTKLNHLILST